MLIMVVQSVAFVILGATGAAQALDKIVIQNGSPVPAAAYLDYYVAQEVGFFKEKGPDDKIRYSWGAPQATQIAASGGADMGQIAFESYLYGRAGGCGARLCLVPIFTSVTRKERVISLNYDPVGLLRFDEDHDALDRNHSPAL